VTALADAIEARAQSLADRAHEAMYRDPFWDARFGERGRRFSEEDNLHHVSYLVQALRADAADLLSGYARWLQSVLTTRGMCSRHIAQNFGRLSDALRAEQIVDAEPALALLDVASAALTYDGGPARAVQGAAEPVAARAAQAIGQRHPTWSDPPDSSGAALLRDDLLLLLSYLADALANGRDDLFVTHVRWMASYAAQRGRPATYVRELLWALDEALGDALGDGDVATVRAAFSAADESLDSAMHQD
jgi:hypothetical protein